MHNLIDGIQTRYVPGDFAVVELTSPTCPRPVRCLMTALEPLVYDTLCEFLPDDARAAEIGSYCGGSACILWHGMRRRGKRVTLTCHDLFEPFALSDEQGAVDVLREFDANTRAWGVEATKAAGDSKVTHARHPDGSLDYCFVDGDHTYEGASADIKNFLPKMKQGGWFVVQDCIGAVETAVRDTIPLDMRCILIRPPYGHYVLVCHRDGKCLDEFGRRLDEKLKKFVT